MPHLVILYTGWTPVDPILSVLVSCLVLRSAWRHRRASSDQSAADLAASNLVAIGSWWCGVMAGDFDLPFGG